MSENSFSKFLREDRFTSERGYRSQGDSGMNNQPSAAGDTKPGISGGGLLALLYYHRYSRVLLKRSHGFRKGFSNRSLELLLPL